MKRPNRRRVRAIALWAATVLGAVLLAGFQATAAPPASLPADRAPTARVATAPVMAESGQLKSSFDGVVEAIRQTVLAAQVPGAVVALEVKAGDRVQAGQVLLRLDARAAEQSAAAVDAQVHAARAAQEAATRDFERQKLLFEKNYISRAALDRAEAQYKATQAESAAQMASAGAARTQSGFYVVRAPYAGVVADVAVVLGDMAMPGRPLLTVYDPAALRIKVAVPQTAAARLAGEQRPEVEIPGVAAGRIQPVKAQLLPTVDPATHTLELRLDLPPALKGAVPGMFARAWLPMPGAGDTRLYVPAQALLRRAELAAVYVVGEGGRPLLRQVRPGRAEGGRVEILSGVSEGEQVALDPQAAARLR